MNDLFVVPLTQGHFAIVDAEDAPLVAGKKWHAYANGRTWYAKGRVIEGSRKQVPIHRVITDAPDGRLVDHINGDGLDNRKDNLRLCSRAENIRNIQGVKATNRSGYVGVHWCNHRDKWRAKVVKDRKRYTLGRFSCPVEAAIFRDIAALHLHGEFAGLNFAHLKEHFATEYEYAKGGMA